MEFVKSHNLQNVELFAGDFFRKILHEEKKIDVNYNKKRIQVGRRRNGSIFYLDLSEPCRMTIVGMNGSGKTFLTRGILNRLKKANMSVAIPTDIKDEFYSNKNVLQMKFRKLLLPGEVSKPEKVIVLRPTFFKKNTPDLKEETNNVWYSPDLTKMNKDDFMTFFNLSQLAQPQQACLEYLWTRFQNYMKSELAADSFEFQMFGEWIEDFNDANPATIKSMKMRFLALYDSHFYEAQNRINLAQKVKEGYTISMNLEGYEGFLQGSFMYVHCIIGMMVRELIAARRNSIKDQRINRLVILLEEAPRFIANNMQNSVKTIVEESFDVDRRYGVDWMVITQDLFQMSEKVRNQSRYIFIPANIPFETFKQCFIALGMATSAQAGTTEAMRLHRQMSHQRHEWMVLDRNQPPGSPEKAVVIQPLAPLCEHAEAVE